MARKNSGIDPAAKETGTDKQRRLRRGSAGMFVYSEASVTICVDPTHNEFLKFTFGHERLSPSDSEADLKRTEAAAWKFNEAVIDKRARKIQRLIRQIAAGRQ